MAHIEHSDWMFEHSSAHSLHTHTDPHPDAATSTSPSTQTDSAASVLKTLWHQGEPSGSTSPGQTSNSAAATSQNTGTANASPPTLSVTSNSLTVAAGGSTPLPISVTPASGGHSTSVTISGLTSYESVTDKLDGKVFTGSSITLSAAEVNSGLTLASSYTGSDHPVNTLSVTASETFAHHQTLTSTAQPVTVTDPPASGTTSVSPDGSTITVGYGGSLVTQEGTWTFGSTNHPGYGNDIVLNGTDLTTTAATKLEVAHGVVYQENGQGEWYAYNGGGWTPTSAPDVTALPPSGSATSTLSADGSSVTVGSGSSLVTQDGTWTFGSTNHPGYGNDIVLNGTDLTTTAATKLEVSNGVVYQENGQGQWYAYDAGAWTTTSAPDVTSSSASSTAADPPATSSSVSSGDTSGTSSSGTSTSTDSSTSTAASDPSGSTSSTTSTTASSGTTSTSTATSGATDPAQTTNAFYVSPSGNDSNAGTLAAPFATLARAQEAMEGSSAKTTYVEGGTYNLTSTLTLTAADSGETWQYYAPDGANSAILNGGATSGSNGLVSVILIDGASNVTIDGLQVENFADAGIAVHGGASFENLFTDSVGTANANVVENCIVHTGYDDPAADLGAPFNNGGIVIEGQATNTKVYNNVVYDVNDNGIRAGADDDANRPNDNISGTDIENNVVYDVGGAHNETAGIYMQDTLGESTGMKIVNNYIYDYATGSGDQGRGIYLDFGTSNTTLSGNIIGPTTSTEGGTTAIFLSSGSNDHITGNILDLGSSGDIVALSYLQYASTLNSGAPASMTNNTLENNIIISDYTGSQSTNEFGIPGQTYIEGGVGTPDPATIANNFYYNYAGGQVVTTGNGFSDSNPIVENPQLSGATYAIASDSPVLAASFPGITGGWGPSGYTIQQTATAVSA